MTAKSELLQARIEMIEVLDAKLANVPEWRALRAIDKALGSVDAHPGINGVKRPKPRITGGKKPYGDLAIEAFEASGGPVNTSEIVEFIGARRKLGKDPKKARINIQSGLSRDKRIRSIPWRGGRAWWHANKPAPPENIGGAKLNP
jgi:hypothetical protein